MTDSQNILTHKPGDGGLFASTALCGADFNTSPSGVLRMHEWEYDCAVCRSLVGERP